MGSGRIAGLKSSRSASGMRRDHVAHHLGDRGRAREARAFDAHEVHEPGDILSVFNHEIEISADFGGVCLARIPAKLRRIG